MLSVGRLAHRACGRAAVRGTISRQARPSLSPASMVEAGSVKLPVAVCPRGLHRARLLSAAPAPEQQDGREFGPRAGVELLERVSFEDGRRPAAKWVSQRLTLDKERVGAGAAHRLCRTGALWEGRTEPDGGLSWRRLRPNARLEAGSLVGVRRRASRMTVSLAPAHSGAGPASAPPGADARQPRSSARPSVRADTASATSAAVVAAAAAAVRILNVTPDVVFVHKAAGTPAHSAPQTRGAGPGPLTVIKAASLLLAAHSGAAAGARAAPHAAATSLRLVHRLDTETAGVMVLARHRPAAVALGEMFSAGTVSKVYVAVTDPTADPAIPTGLLAPGAPPDGCRAKACTCGASVVTAPLPADPLLVSQSGARAGLSAAQSVAAFSSAAARTSPRVNSRDWEQAVARATKLLPVSAGAGRQLAASWATIEARDAESTLAPATWRETAPTGCWMLRQSAGGATADAGGKPPQSVLSRASALVAALSAKRGAAAASLPHATWLCLPTSGRKHQVRLHALLWIGAPLVGDARYGTAAAAAAAGSGETRARSGRRASRGNRGGTALGLIAAAIELPPLPDWAQMTAAESHSPRPLAATADPALV